MDPVIVALVILITLPDGTPFRSGALFKSHEACVDAMEALAPAMELQWPGAALTCVETSYKLEDGP